MVRSEQQQERSYRMLALNLRGRFQRGEIGVRDAQRDATELHRLVNRAAREAERGSVQHSRLLATAGILDRLRYSLRGRTDG